MRFRLLTHFVSRGCYILPVGYELASDVLLLSSPIVHIHLLEAAASCPPLLVGPRMDGTGTGT